MLKTDDPRLYAPQCHGLKPVEEVYTNPWFSVCNRGGYYTVERERFQIIVLPVVDHEGIVLVRVKRPILADATLELPAGGSKKGESSIEAAFREFAEETGICIRDQNRFIPQMPVCINPNRYPVLPSIFRIDITMAEFDARAEHDSEIESVQLFAHAELKTMLVNGDIYVTTPAFIISRYLFELSK